MCKIFCFPNTGSTTLPQYVLMGRLLLNGFCFIFYIHAGRPAAKTSRNLKVIKFGTLTLYLCSIAAEEQTFKIQQFNFMESSISTFEYNIIISVGLEAVTSMF